MEEVKNPLGEVHESVPEMRKMYIAVLDEVPDFMVPTLVAHTVLAAHIEFEREYEYEEWMDNSFKKVTLRVNQKEFDKISEMQWVFLGHENTTLGGQKSCAVVMPMKDSERPNVLKFAKMWKPVAE